MLNSSDLDAAVMEGIISRDQADRLVDFARRTANPNDDALEFSQDTRDEPFRLLRGFRDFFIAVGIVIFAVGATSLAIGFLGVYNAVEGFVIGSDNQAIGLVATEFAVRAVLNCLGLVLVAVALAEWITRYLRLPLASLVISIVFSLWTGALLVALMTFVFPDVALRPGLLSDAWVVAYFGAILGMLAFYWRYRLPFALLPLAVAAVGLLSMIIQAAIGEQQSEEHTRFIVGGLGFLVFLAAMWFDLSDRLRVKRYSECAFWLHLLAAPMMVHAMLSDQLINSTDITLVFVTLAFLALIALLIDRRALLVAGLSYFAIAISEIISSSDVMGDQQFAFTAAILGACVLCLGLGWSPIRRGLLGLLPFEALKSRLPPVTAVS